MIDNVDVNTDNQKKYYLDKYNEYNYSVISTARLKKGLVGGLSKKLRTQINNNFDELELKSLRERNHDKFYKIDINSIKKMSEYYPTEADEIIREYAKIDSLKLLEDDYYNAMNNYKILAKIEKNVDILMKRLNKSLIKLSKNNDAREKQINIENINSKVSDDKVLVKKIKSKYETLMLYNMNSDFSDSVFEYERQLVRQQYIEEIEVLYEEYQSRQTSRAYDKKLLDINVKIKGYILKYQKKIEELRRLISKNDPNYNEFKDFINYYMDLIHYDNTNLLKAKRELELLEFNTVFQFTYDKLKNAIEQNNAKNELYYQQISKDVFKKCLLSIRNNYILLFSAKVRDQIIDYINKIDELDVMSSSVRAEYESFLKPLIVKIWKMSITDIKKYQSGNKFKFICCPDNRENNKYWSMLITDKEVTLVNDLGNYQSGYLYPYKNVIQVTNSQDMKDDDCPFSYLVTPEQLESDFINNKKSNRIIQDSYYLEPLALYYIDNGHDIPSDLLKKAINEGLEIVRIVMKDYKK